MFSVLSLRYLVRKPYIVHNLAYISPGTCPLPLWWVLGILGQWSIQRSGWHMGPGGLCGSGHLGDLLYMEQEKGFESEFVVLNQTSNSISMR